MDIEPDAMGVEPDTIDLVGNGGFELGSNAPFSWSPTVILRTVPFVTFAWDTVGTHQGERAIKIAIAEDHPGEAISYNWFQSIRHGFEPGDSFELAAWVKVANVPHDVFVVAQFWNAQSMLLGIASTQGDFALGGTIDWVEVATSFRVPPGTARIVLRLGIAAPANNGGTVWFDDVTLRPS